MKPTIKIFLRADNINLDGTRSVYLRFTVNRKIKNFSLQITTLPKFWNIVKCEIKNGDIEHLRKNKYIRKHKNKAENIIDKYFFDEKFLSIEEFERAFKNNNFNNKSFYDFIESEMKTLDISEGTRKNYIKQISKLKSFRKELYFPEINVKFLNDYDYFLKTKREKPNNDNTRKASMNFIRQVVNKARKQDITDIEPFLNYTIGTIKGDKESLTKAELDQLELLLNKDVLVHNEKAVLEYFLFDCYTGLRISDLTAIKYSNIEKYTTDGKEYNFLVFKSVKTGKLTEVPLMPFSEKFIKPNNLPNQNIFKVQTGQGTNRVLKRIMKKANINKHITAHCGRYTFSSVAMELGFRGEIVQEILKHSKISETVGYMNFSRKVLIEEMKKFEK